MNTIELKKNLVYNQLKKDILSGKLTPGQKLPKELDLSKQLKVGNGTLRFALSRLEEEMLVARIPSKGTFIMPHQKALPRTILVITFEMGQKTAPAPQILPGIQNAALQNGIAVETCDIDYINSLSKNEIYRILKEKNIFAVISISSNYSGKEPIIKKLKAAKKPVILPHAMPDDTKITGFASILTPYKAAWRQAVRHLCEQGHTRIGTVIYSEGGQSFRGYSQNEHLRLLSRYGADWDEALIGYIAYEKDSIESTVIKWMKSEAPPTAILCFSDFFAIHVYEVLKKLSIHIPKDVAVMGFCGFPGGKFLNPSLSTVDFGYSNIGKMSVELALNSSKWFNKPGKTPPVLIKKCKLIKRESTDYMRKE